MKLHSVTFCYGSFSLNFNAVAFSSTNSPRNTRNFHAARLPAIRLFSAVFNKNIQFHLTRHKWKCCCWFRRAFNKVTFAWSFKVLNYFDYFGEPRRLKRKNSYFTKNLPLIVCENSVRSLSSLALTSIRVIYNFTRITWSTRKNQPAPNAGTASAIKESTIFKVIILSN